MPGGEKIAERTANGRLGILGGLSILGTTGIVIPYSCSAWIHSIHRGVDVARASGCAHIGAATGETSEAAIRALYGLPDHALIEMGDFVGGLLKYLREHPVPRLTIAGGPAKMTKLAEGKLDLHSKRGAVDLAALAERVARGGRRAVACRRDRRAPTAGCTRSNLPQAAGFDLPALVADGAWATAARVLAGQSGELETDCRRPRRARAREQRVSEGLAPRPHPAPVSHALRGTGVLTDACGAPSPSEEKGARRSAEGRATITRPAPAHGPRETGAHNPRCKVRSRKNLRPRAPGRRG